MNNAPDGFGNSDLDLLRLLLPEGMLVQSELHWLYETAKTRIGPGLAVVDAGSFCGASTYAVASGLSARWPTGGVPNRIYAYDKFVADDHYTRAYIQNNFYSFRDTTGQIRHRWHEVGPDESFRHIFDYQVREYSHLITVHEGDFLTAPCPEEPIGLLHVDVAKTLQLQSRLFRDFVPLMIAGESLLVQQDFHHPYHPYIQVAMEFLDSYFHIEVSTNGASRVYRLIRPIAAADLQRVIDYDFEFEEQSQLMKRCISRAMESDRALLTVCLIRLQLSEGRTALAEETWSALSAGLDPQTVADFGHHVPWL